MTAQSTADLIAALRTAGIVPVITITSADQAVELARTLVDAGLPVLEVTLRTAAALDAIQRIASDVPDAIIGAGTIRRPADIDAAVNAGSRFLVSPGTTPDLIVAAANCAVPFLPGCATPSEAMELADAGFETLKFFPAAAYGGAATLKAVSAPLAGLSFVPTGGIGPDNLETYLRLPNVLAVGGSWMVKSEWLAAGDFERIGAEARSASAAVAQIRS